MHRVVALLLIPALITIPGLLSSLHTHAYDDHDHPEHHHGLSAHDHEAVPTHPDDGLPRLEGCDPGTHVIPFAFVCVPPPQVHVVEAEVTRPASSGSDCQVERIVRHEDVRVHGPPPRSQASPRAPPLIAHA